jgi:hypothetical protein
MQRYHFNVQDSASGPDLEGTRFASLDAARNAAVRLAGDMLREQPAAFWDQGEWVMDVTDDAGLVLFSLLLVASMSPALGRRG